MTRWTLDAVGARRGVRGVRWRGLVWSTAAGGAGKLVWLVAAAPVPSARNNKIYEFGRLRPYAEEPFWALSIRPLLKASTTGLIEPTDYSQD